MRWRAMKLPSLHHWLRWSTVFEGIAVAVVMLAASAAVLTALVVRVPADFLVRDPDAPRSIGVLARIGKNLLGVVLVIAGLVMSIPGVPGQGVLTMLMGLLLLDLPGKRRFERRLLSRPQVLCRLNRMRERFGREPLVAPAGPGR
jgi:hypothetical protein